MLKVGHNLISHFGTSERAFLHIYRVTYKNLTLLKQSWPVGVVEQRMTAHLPQHLIMPLL